MNENFNTYAETHNINLTWTGPGDLTGPGNSDLINIDFIIGVLETLDPSTRI